MEEDLVNQHMKLANEVEERINLQNDIAKKNTEKLTVVQVELQTL